MLDTIESEVKKTILEDGEDFEIKGRTFRIKSPNLATLITASSYISQLPVVKLDSENIVEECLSIAKECEQIADVIAILIVGVNREKRVKRWWEFWNREREFDKVKRFVLNELTPNDIYKLLARLLSFMQLESFFGITTFLININLLKSTRKVEIETTASGR